jgi:non-ribosomal peptide synthetase component F
VLVRQCQRPAPDRAAAGASAGFGNGQQLHQDTLQALCDQLALHVTRFARNPQHLQEAPAVSPGACEQSTAWAGWRRWPTGIRSTALRRPAGARPGQPGRAAGAEPAPARRILGIAYAGQRHSYRQLHARTAAIQQALLLLAGGDTSPPVVAVCMGKSPELYASLLAVLGCAAIYLPLDPATPAARRQRILDDAGACVLLHDGQPPAAIAHLDVRDIAPLQGPELPSLVLREAHVGQPCVAIYTSGTTGQPKGVLLSQGNLMHFMAWYREHVALDRHSRVLQFSTIGFDASLLDILPTFACAAELVLPSEDQRRDPRQLLALIHSQEITHAFLPPALLSILPRDEHLGLST